MSFKNILDKYLKISFSEPDKGNRFERLMQAYLQTDPKYAYLFKKVWLWNEFESRSHLKRVKVTLPDKIRNNAILLPTF